MTPPLQQRAPNIVPQSQGMSVKRENPGKRPVAEVIDLTGDDDDIPSFRKKKQARTEIKRDSATPVPSMPGSFVVDDDDIRDELMYIGSQARPDDGPRELYGIIASKVVGLQYYRGMASMGEAVILERYNQCKQVEIYLTGLQGTYKQV